MRSIGLVSSEPHYLDHIQPIWDLIPDTVKSDKRDVILVGGYADVKSNPTKPYIYVEHGAGQSYDGGAADPLLYRSTAPYYNGSRGHSFCKLFICPNDDVAARWHERYPATPTAVVGCPKLDRWHNGSRGATDGRTVALTFHWNALFTGVPETASAFDEYWRVLLPAVDAWRRDGWTVIGTSHPRYDVPNQFWVSNGIEAVSADSVLDRADVLIADNTSMQPEFLSLGRKVVWLNSARYRKDVSHGGRFWDWPELGGVQIDSPDDLPDLRLDDVPETLGHPYAFADGLASDRAARAILSLL